MESDTRPGALLVTPEPTSPRRLCKPTMVYRASDRPVGQASGAPPLSLASTAKGEGSPGWSGAWNSTPACAERDRWPGTGPRPHRRRGRSCRSPARRADRPLPDRDRVRRRPRRPRPAPPSPRQGLEPNLALELGLERLQRHPAHLAHPGAPAAADLHAVQPGRRAKLRLQRLERFEAQGPGDAGSRRLVRLERLPDGPALDFTQGHEVGPRGPYV